MVKASNRQDLRDEYDVIIVGGGPAGIFAALELHQHGVRDVLLAEKGRDLEHRVCPSRDQGVPCRRCHMCSQVTGWGGAGAFSDGKLTLSADVGGRLKEYLGLAKANELVQYVDQIYVKFGAPRRVYGTGEEVESLQRRASAADLRLIPVPIRHMGSEHCVEVLRGMYGALSEVIDVRTNLPVVDVLLKGRTVEGARLADGRVIRCRYLILAPGRDGSSWLTKLARSLGLTLHNNPVDLGVRVEVPAPIMEELSSTLYESKLEFYSQRFDDRVRTFCMCPAGEITTERTGEDDPVLTVNGHSYAERKTENTNFALLVSTDFTEPFHEPIAYGKYIARLANILSGGVIVQRLGDLWQGRRSTPTRIDRGIVKPTLKTATPGDLSFVFPYRYLTDILEMLTAMDKLAPGVASRHTLLYGVEAKFYSSRLQLNEDMETEIRNMFAAGDGAGVTRGLIQASASGVVAARSILSRCGVRLSCQIAND